MKVLVRPVLVKCHRRVWERAVVLTKEESVMRVKCAHARRRALLEYFLPAAICNLLSFSLCVFLFGFLWQPCATEREKGRERGGGYEGKLVGVFERKRNGACFFSFMIALF